MTFLEDNCINLRGKLLNSTFLMVFERENSLTRKKKKNCEHTIIYKTTLKLLICKIFLQYGLKHSFKNSFFASPEKLEKKKEKKSTSAIFPCGRQYDLLNTEVSLQMYYWEARSQEDREEEDYSPHQSVTILMLFWIIMILSWTVTL